MANKRVVEYADSEDSEEEMSQPPRKRPRINFSDDEEDYEDYYSIKPVRQTESRVFRSKANIYEVDIKKFPDDVSPLHFIPRLFDDMIENIKRHCQVEGSDKIRMTISHPGLKLGVFISWRDVSALTGEIITQEIEKVMQSNDKFKINNGQMRMDVTVCRLPTDAGRKYYIMDCFLNQRI